MIIATRLLRIRKSGAVIDVQIRIYIPEIEGTSWKCKYEIDWPNDTRVSEGYGVDSVQALHISLQKLGLDLYMSDYHSKGQLFWEKPDEGYGFPVPKNGRDFLIGEDKRFEG
ncbi:MAG: hypothetical protein K2Y56_08040 [Methylobacterium sp.]|uniref:DUF6968 family protein n=1 Tax=Methylobacterium sp. TaxID=409 RepID=UPI0025E26F6C|nr:hypothetical protein [Methylobacterium sp.]MBX9931475.1 hypothetical protein [Methylobacterium sp.]